MAIYTTVADSSSNSYATLSELTALLFGTSKTKWNALTDSEQIDYAVRATTLIDMLPYAGCKYDTSYGHQALRFPRNNHYTLDDASSEIKYPYIPVAVKKAQAAIITSLLDGFNNNSMLYYRSAGVTSVGLGSGVSMSFSSKAVTREDLLCTEAQLLLKPFMAMKVIRLDRG